MSSSTANSYVRQIKECDNAIKRLNRQSKDARTKKKLAQQHLAKWMEKNNVDTYEGISFKKIAPKPPSKRKPAKQKKLDAIRLFADIGANDPEGLWEDFQRTQKIAESLSSGE